MDQLISQVLHDRYRIQSLLGRQTGRRTFLASHVQTGLSVVIKLLLFGPDFNWDDLKLFEREAEVLQSLDHPSIPKYLDCFEVETELGKGFALVQTYIEARSLQEWVQSGRSFSEEELKAIAKELLEILHYLHNRQPSVIHRDIKPSNVLLGDRSGNSPGKVYLVDFGSVQTAPRGGTITIVGTYGYMPPEQFGGRALPASDLYGLGTTLIYLATGQHPADLPENNLQVEFAKFANLSQSFTGWIQWLTNPGLSKRPASAEEAIKHFHLAPQQLSSQLPTQRFSVGIRRPNSSIQLDTTLKTLEVTVPHSQFCVSELRKNRVDALYSCAICSAFVGFFTLLATGLGWVAIVVILIVGCLLLRKASYTPSRYKITFRRESNSTFVYLASDNLKDSVRFSQKKLKSILAGPDTGFKYRLAFKISDSDDTFYITGSRAEIQWLCDDLNDWTGIKIQYQDFTNSGI